MTSVSLTPRGLVFVQVIRAAALAKGDLSMAAAYAEERHGFGSPVARILKAAVAGGGLAAAAIGGQNSEPFNRRAPNFSTWMRKPPWLADWPASVAFLSIRD
jgi:hypothetical protein